MENAHVKWALLVFFVDVLLYKCWLYSLEGEKLLSYTEGDAPNAL